MRLIHLSNSPVELCIANTKLLIQTLKNGQNKLLPIFKLIKNWYSSKSLMNSPSWIQHPIMLITLLLFKNCSTFKNLYFPTTSKMPMILYINFTIYLHYFAPPSKEYLTTSFLSCQFFSSRDVNIVWDFRRMFRIESIVSKER